MEPTTTQPTTKRPSIDAVEGAWPSFGFDDANSGHAPDSHGPTGEPRVRWNASAPIGLGVPVVDAETVFVPTDTEAVVALYATDGTERWRSEVPGRHVRTPAVADDLVCVAGDSLRAFDVGDGSEQWSYDSFEGANGGLTASEGTLFFCANESAYAVDAATGERQWSTAITDAPSTYGPPAVVDETLVLRTGGGDESIVALDASDGTEQWRTTFGSNLSVPSGADGTIYVGVERAYTDPYEEETVFAVDVASGERTPLFTTPGRGPPDVAITDEGLVVYEQVTNPPDDPSTETQTVVETNPGTTPDSTDDGKSTHVFGISRDGVEQWATSVTDGSEDNGWEFTAPAVADGIAYVLLDSGRLIGLDVATGDRRLDFSPGRYGYDVVGPVVVDGVAFAAGSGGVLAIA